MGVARILGITALGALAASAAWRVETMRSARAPGYHLLYLPSGRYLKAMAFGYPEVAADLIYIWSIQYYSNYQIQDRYDYLDQIYRRVIAELDPRFVDPYLVGSMIMSVEAGRDDLALKLLSDGTEKNPGEWILPFQAGFLCYQKLADYACARDRFEQTLRIPDAPATVRRLYAEMYNRLGDKKSSLRYWTEILESADSDYVRRIAWLHVHDLAIDVQLEDLDQLLDRYAAAHGHPARSLEDLVRGRLLSGIPRDPNDQPYLLDRTTGRAASASRRLLQR